MCAQRRLRSAWASAQSESDQSSLCTHWIANDPLCLHVDSEETDQTLRMSSLFWVFAGRRGHLAADQIIMIKAYRYLDIVAIYFTSSGLSELSGSTLLFEIRVLPNSGLEGVTSSKQTLSNRVSSFHAVFVCCISKGPLLDYLIIDCISYFQYLSKVRTESGI